MKGVVDKTETNIEKERIKETLFEPQSKSYDLTPSFQTENELEFDIMDKEYKNYIDGIMLDLDAGKPINKKNKLLLKGLDNGLEFDIMDKEYKDYSGSIMLDLDTGKPINKKNRLLLKDVNNALFYNQPLLLEDKATQNKKKYKKALQKYGLSTNISDIMDRPLIKLPPKPTKKQQNIDFYTNIAFDLPIKSNLQRQDIKNKEPIILGRRKISDTNSSIASQANTELAIIPTKKGKVGRPTGSKNKPKNTLDIRPTTLNLFR
ncbi:MAG: hypothetical protein EBU53_00895 [Proteobacteria bacterium]|nr:hypothetical protein [Pseudomonadota bacterium]